VRDHALETWFHAFYGSPLLQALVGLKASEESQRRGPGKDAAHKALVDQRIQELIEGIQHGGPREATIRALLHIRMPDGNVDERGFRFLEQMRDEAGKGLTLAAFKGLLREQYFMLLLDEQSAIEAIPDMLARDPDLASELGDRLSRLVEVVGLRSQSAKDRLAEMEALFKSNARRAASKATDRAQPEPERAARTRAHVARMPKHA
jgi:hypothetical protein